MSLPALDIAHLSVEERLQLIEDLWASFEQNPAELPVPPAQQAELERRVAAYEQDPSRVVSYEDIRRRYNLD